MAKQTPPNHSPDFQVKVALAGIKSDRAIAQMSDQFGIHVSQITVWKEQLQASAADVFGPSAGAHPSKPPIDIKALHAEIGELTLENNFLLITHEPPPWSGRRNRGKLACIQGGALWHATRCCFNAACRT